VSKVRFQIAVSLDGYIAGPNQSEENPLGEGGEQLHEWAFALEAWRKPHGLEGGEVNPSSAVIEAAFENVGAIIMGRSMFGGGPGPWGDWEGWWGDEPPFHVPVFVVTHHPRDPLEKGDTTFYFVTEGIDAALEQAREAAGDGSIDIGGGADVIRQYLRAGHVEEMQLHVVPILLGGGERLLDGVAEAGLELEQTAAIEAPGVTHLSYSVKRASAS
jgi:dihydrofolate reductase